MHPCRKSPSHLSSLLPTSHPTLLSSQVIVCSRASPTKLREFAEAADALPIENLYCSRDGYADLPEAI